MKTIGLLVMAYGTPRKAEDIERYYTHIRRGRTPTPEQIKELEERYEMIGGLSPLTEITESQVGRLANKLNEQFANIKFKAYLGLKHIDPYIEDAIKAMKDDGIEEAVSIVLTPHYSVMSVKDYNQRALAEAEKLEGPVIHTIDYWYDEPKFIEYWSTQFQKRFNNISEAQQNNAVVIFSAHSLPERILQMNDPYAQQVTETAKMIAAKAGIIKFAIGWQSAGKSPEPWLGPDVKDLTKELYEKFNYTTFIYCPVGFVADHLEVLYDNDIECKRVTEELGVNYLRLDMPNAKNEFIDTLVSAVKKKLTEKAVI